MADRVIWQFVESAPDSISFLAEQLKPAEVEPASLESVPKLIAELDAEEFGARERATERLRSIGPAARPLLEKTLAAGVSFEQRMRIRQVLRDLAAPPSARLDSPEAMAKVRAVYALEHIGTTPARKLLQQIADSPRPTVERPFAKAALGRLAKRETQEASTAIP
jgi:hypothetical protein